VWWKMIQRLNNRRAQRGNIGLIAALAAVPLTGLAMYALSMTEVTSMRAKMQAAADAGALAGASELSVATRVTSGIEETAETLALTSFPSQATGGSRTERPVFDATADRTEGFVTVKGTYSMPRAAMFGGPIPINVTATAESLQSMPLCVLQTDELGSNGLKVDDQAVIRAPGCLVHANTNIAVGNSARIEAGLVQAVGTASGPIMPSGNTGALPIPDPFAALNYAPRFACPPGMPDIVYDKPVKLTLPPITNCANVTLTGDVDITLAPGDHYFMGKLEIKGRAKIRGTDVAMIFGSDDSFSFNDNVEVRLSARRSGPLAGFLFLTTRDNDEKFVIASDQVRELLGTIYIPNAELEIATKASVAEDSAWSVIVAKTLTLKENPILVINKNYVASGVPVPKGVGPSNGAPRLTE
jgi:Flp pilus assembly protein TadG